jgi:hypothetical protein
MTGQAAIRSTGGVRPQTSAAARALDHKATVQVSAVIRGRSCDVIIATKRGTRTSQSSNCYRI